MWTGWAIATAAVMMAEAWQRLAPTADGLPAGERVATADPSGQHRPGFGVCAAMARGDLRVARQGDALRRAAAEHTPCRGGAAAAHGRTSPVPLCLPLLRDPLRACPPWGSSRIARSSRPAPMGEIPDGLLAGWRERSTWVAAASWRGEPCKPRRPPAPTSPPLRHKSTALETASDWRRTIAVASPSTGDGEPPRAGLRPRQHHCGLPHPDTPVAGLFPTSALTPPPPPRPPL